MFCGVSLGWEVSLCNKQFFFMKITEVRYNKGGNIFQSSTKKNSSGCPKGCRSWGLILVRDPLPQKAHLGKVSIRLELK